jgi:alpha-methylacyl-CoA racemase
MAEPKPLPLSGIKVLEFEGLAPTVFTGMVLADFGAEVTIIARAEASILEMSKSDMNRGKRSICLDLKNPLHKKIIQSFYSKCDVVIDCFRPGVLEKLGLNPLEFN